MAHAQKPDFVFRRNARVHLNRRGRQFSRLLAAEVCASALVMLDTPCSEVVWGVLATHSIRQCPLQLPSRASPCAITFQLESTSVYFSVSKLRNRFLLSFWLVVLVWNTIESCARPLLHNSSVSVLGCQKREWERERGNECLVKVRVRWGRRERKCFHYEETEWRFYGYEISKAAPYSAGKYRL